MVKRDGKVLHGREGGVFDNDGGVEGTPRVVVEIAADHFQELGPFEECVVAGVGADEAFAVLFDERHEVLLLLRIQIVAGAEIEDGVEVIQVPGIARGGGYGLFGDELGIGADVHFVRAGIVPQPLHGGQRVGDGIVLKGGEGIAPGENAFGARARPAVAGLARRAGSARRRSGEQ